MPHKETGINTMPAGSREAGTVAQGRGDTGIAQGSVYFLTGTEVLYLYI